MPSFVRSTAISAALIGAALVATPPATARADSTAGAAIQLAQATAPAPPAPAHKRTAKSRGETVDQRIANLHKELKITPDEEQKWSAVAQAMHDNAANMEKLVAAKRAAPPQSMSAVDDLKTYQQFAQAHVDGLNNLVPAFEALYVSMPDDQKKLADKVFQAAAQRRGRARHH